MIAIIELNEYVMYLSKKTRRNTCINIDTEDGKLKLHINIDKMQSLIDDLQISLDDYKKYNSIK